MSGDRLSRESSSAQRIWPLARYQWYVEGLKKYAARSANDYSFSGTHLGYFAEYLDQPFTPQNNRLRRQTNGSISQSPEEAFAVLHDFAAEPGSQVKVLHRLRDLDLIRQATDESQSQAQLLFLRGHASPEWLTAIGATFDVDPEFFFEHTDLYAKSRVHPAWSHPALPSRAAQRPRLRVSTLGHLARDNARSRSEAHVEHVRGVGRAMFGRYMDAMRKGEGIKVGTSLLRRYSVHSASDFSFEQDVSVYVVSTSKGWFGIAWLDIGDDLQNAPEGSKLAAPIDGDRKNTVFLSTVRHEARALFDMGDLSIQSTRGNQSHGIPQNGRVLPFQYGSYLDPSVAMQSSFYAFSELFGFVRDSELQFLNMLRSTIATDIDHATASKADEASLLNLLSNRQVLVKHIERLEDNIEALRSSAVWPTSAAITAAGQRDSEESACELLKDYQRLLERARALASECDRGVDVVMNIASIAESRKVLLQAVGVERLTRLAFVFVPMSFTSAFFGMNFKQLGQGHLSIWIWFVVSFPVFVIAVILMSTRIQESIMGRVMQSIHVLSPERRRRVSESAV